MTKHLLYLTIIMTIAGCAKQPKAQKNNIDLIQDCYKERKLERTLTDVSAKLEIFGDDFLIATEDARYVPCELPLSFRKNGINILFSGEVKEVYPQERWAGLPIQLTKIRLIEK